MIKSCGFFTLLAGILTVLFGLGAYSSNSVATLPPTPIAITSIPLSTESSSINTVTDPRTQEINWGDPQQLYGFGWGLFLYISQMQSDGATMWENWMSSTDLYASCAKPPDTLNQPPTIPEDVQALADKEGITNLRPLLYTDKFLESTIEIDGVTLTATNNTPIRYEVRMNPSTVQTVVDNGFYNRANQVAFFEDTSAPPLQFNWDALEVKASWRQMEPSEDTSRYYIAYGWYYDQNQQPVIIKVGLTGLHITSKELPDWVWITFEQMDNQTMTNAPLVDPIPPDLQAYNAQIQSQLGGTPWQYYNLRGVQINYTDINNVPTILANTQIETNFQKTSSCITCHALATIGNSFDGRLAFFDFAGGTDFEAYVGNIANLTFYATDDTPVYYNGNFGFSDDTKTLRYKQLDFVWSFKEAQTCSTGS